MGLPIFVVPTEPDVAIKAAEKVASVPRSSIRRQRTVRRSQPSVSVENIRRRMQGMAANSSTERYDVWENGGRDQRPPVRRSDELSSASLARGARALEDERMRLRDNISFERQNPQNGVIDGPLMPPAPEPRDYSAAEVRRREIQRLLEVRRDIRRMARRLPAPTPPYTDTDLALMARMDTESPQTSSDTPARSPRLMLGELETTVSISGRPQIDTSEALQFMLTRSSREGIPPTGSTPRQRIRPTEGSGPQEEQSEADRQSRAEISERFRVLNRVSNHIERSHRFLRQQRLDGLGDRDRSLSPDGGPAAWDTLLTSITPDPQPPSVGSSFASASAAAAASTSSGNSGPTSSSTPTTSFGIADEAQTLQDCDLDSALNSDEEDDMQMLNQIINTSSDRQPWRTSWADVAGTRADRVAQASSTEDTEHLGGMQRIISRLAEREDIPEEWWRMAGLRREPAS